MTTTVNCNVLNRCLAFTPTKDIKRILRQLGKHIKFWDWVQCCSEQGTAVVNNMIQQMLTKYSNYYYFCNITFVAVVPIVIIRAISERMSLHFIPREAPSSVRTRKNILPKGKVYLISRNFPETVYTSCLPNIKTVVVRHSKKELSPWFHKTLQFQGPHCSFTSLSQQDMKRMLCRKCQTL